MRWAVLPLIALLITLIASCGGDGDSGTVTPTPSPSASPTIAAGEYPTGFLDFVRMLDRDLATGAIDLAAFTRFTGWNCPSNLFPGSGMSCGPAEEGKGVPAIDIGAEGSEGELYDALSYDRYLLDWIYEKPPASSDVYGDGAPRVYAIADEQDRAESYQGQLGTYEVFATRLVTSPTDQSVGRSTLTFFVSGTMQGWLISDVLRVPDLWLDPNSAQARAEQVTDIFKTWRRWDESQPPGPLVSRWPTPVGREIAYFDINSALHVSKADGTDDRVITDRPCGESGAGKAPPIWSRDADRLGLVCGLGSLSGVEPFLEVYTPEAGSTPAVIHNVNSLIWAPKGHTFAYQTADISRNGGSALVHRYDLDTGQDTLIHDNAVLLDYFGGDSFLLGLNPHAAVILGDTVPFAAFEANFYDSGTGTTRRIARFDDGRQFWTVAPGESAIVLGGDAGRKSGGPKLDLYDVASGAETQLDNFAIGYGSEGIPKANVKVATLGQTVIWADYGSGEPGVVVTIAALDGSHATRLGVMPELIDGVSSDDLVLFQAHDTVMTLRDLKSGAETTWHNATVGAIAPVPIPRS